MHGAVFIRPQDAHARILQSLDELSVGMSVRIVFSRGYDSDERLHGTEEFRHRRVLASVMADLQHIGVFRFSASSSRLARARQDTSRPIQSRATRKLSRIAVSPPR